MTAVPPTCGLLLLMRIVLLMHSVQNSLQLRTIAFRAAFRCPLFFFRLPDEPVIDMSPSRGLILVRNSIAYAEWHRSFELLWVSGLGLRHLLFVSGTQLEPTYTFNLDYIQDVQAVVIMPIFTTGPPTLCNILYYHALYIYIYVLPCIYFLYLHFTSL